jgi:hypothetical protein
MGMELNCLLKRIAIIEQSGIFFGSLYNNLCEIIGVMMQRGEKYNQHGITPDDYLAASPALNEIKVIVLRLEAVKDDPEEMMKIYPDLINYALMDMCRITNERGRDE